MANLERKVLPVLGVGFVILSGNTYVFNPLFQLSPGVGSGSRIGRKIQNAFMKMQFRICHLGQNQILNTLAENSQVRILHLFSAVIDSAAVASNTLVLNPAGITQGDIFRQITNNAATYAEVDTNRWKVLKDVVYTVGRRATTDQRQSRIVRRWFMPLGKRVTYRDDTTNSQALRGQHYLVVVGAFCDSVDGGALIGDRVAEFWPSGTIQWTDA